MHLITEGTGQEGTWYSPWLRDITWADFCSWKNSGVWQSGTEEPTLGWELKDLDFLSDSATLFLCDLTLNYFLSLLLCFLTCKNERGCEDLYVSFHPIQTMTDRWMPDGGPVKSFQESWNVRSRMSGSGDDLAFSHPQSLSSHCTFRSQTG